MIRSMSASRSTRLDMMPLSRVSTTRDDGPLGLRTISEEQRGHFGSRFASSTLRTFVDVVAQSGFGQT